MASLWCSVRSSCLGCSFWSKTFGLVRFSGEIGRLLFNCAICIGKQLLHPAALPQPDRERPPRWRAALPELSGSSATAILSLLFRSTSSTGGSRSRQADQQVPATCSTEVKTRTGRQTHRRPLTRSAPRGRRSGTQTRCQRQRQRRCCPVDHHRGRGRLCHCRPLACAWLRARRRCRCPAGRAAPSGHRRPGRLRRHRHRGHAARAADTKHKIRTATQQFRGPTSGSRCRLRGLRSPPPSAAAALPPVTKRNQPMRKEATEIAASLTGSCRSRCCGRQR